MGYADSANKEELSGTEKLKADIARTDAALAESDQMQKVFIRGKWAEVENWATKKQSETGNWLYAIPGAFGKIFSSEEYTNKIGFGLAIAGALKGGSLPQNRGKPPAPLDKIFSTKAPKQVTPGTQKLEGQYINDKGRVEPWEAHYDEYGRQIGRTDYNAGNQVQGIPDTHFHTYKYGPGMNGMETGSHIPGVFKP